MKKFNFFNKLLVLLVVILIGNVYAYAGTKRIYFDYSLYSGWPDAGAIAKAHVWNGSGSHDYTMTLNSDDQYYYYDIDDSYTDVCFKREGPNGEDWGWTHSWSMGSNNRFKIKLVWGDYGTDKGKLLPADSDDAIRWAPGSTIDGLIDVNNPHNQAFSFSESTGTYSVTLSAHCTYQFKILEGKNAYGLNNNVFTGPISNYASSTSDYAYRLATAGAGTYTFTWDNSTHKLSISFPSVNHPSIDYVYLYDHSWGYEKQYVHVWNSATSIAETTWPGTKVPNQTTINGETFYYCAPGDYANFQFSDGVKNSNATNDLTTSEGYGKYQKNISSSWGWRVWSFTVTLNAQHTDEGSTNPENPSVEFNNTALSNSAGAVTPPTRPGYTFGGYWNTATCNDKMVISSTGAWQGSVAGFTDSDRKWIHEGGTADLYAKWTPKTTTVSFNQTGGTGGQTSSVTATYDAGMPTPITRPTLAGYDFAGYYDGVGGTGTKYYNSDGSSAKAWDKEDATFTLHAKWEPVSMLTFNKDGNWNLASNWSPACVPTSEHAVTISAAVEVNTTDAVAKSVTIDGGSLTIKKNGVLNVAGAISNSTAANIVIETAGDGQGALIYDISKGSPAATVNLATSESSTTGDFQYIASPVGGVSVASTLSGPGVYTYAWIEGKGWDRRGYYDEFAGNEVIVISGKAGCTFSGILNPTTSASITCTATPESDDAQGVNMIPNTLTAPIKIAEMNLEATYEGAIHIWNGSGWDEYAKESVEETVVIPAFQGYAVLTETGGTVSFDYTTAVRNASTHNDALKAPQRAESDIYDHITIGVTTNNRKEDMLLYENAQFTTGIDKGWEAVYMEGDGRYGELYAHAEREMSILATPDLEGTVLGFAPGQADSYTISFEGDGKGYYLNDVMKEESTLIEEGNTYAFTSDEATNATRFVISKTPISKTPTSVDNLNDGVKARKQLIDGALYIIRDGRIYTTTGSVVK